MAAGTRLAPAARPLWVVTMWKSIRRWPVLLAVLVTVGALAVGVVFLPHGGQVSLENCERIQYGMTEAEVRAILGKPWYDSLLDLEGPDWVWGFKTEHWQYKYVRQWVGDDGYVILVLFNDNGRVVHPMIFYDSDRPHSSLPARVWHRVRARLGW